MSKETPLPTPFSIDWCNLTDPPCPFKGYPCGIKERLRGFYQKSIIKKEAESLMAIAEKDPKEFHRICQRSLESKR